MPKEIWLEAKNCLSSGPLIHFEYLIFKFQKLPSYIISEFRSVPEEMQASQWTTMQQPGLVSEGAEQEM